MLEETASSRALSQTVRLLITCPDRPGIVAAVSQFIFAHGANITELDQYSTDPEGGTFFLRLAFHSPHLDVSKEALTASFNSVIATPFKMNWVMRCAWPLPRLAIMASQTEHCLMELLWRWSRGELLCEIPMVISNHPDLREAVEHFGVPFHYLPVASGDPAGKLESEAQALGLLDGRTDGLILARYMRILSPQFIERYGRPIINIHHSFLPAFAGADPYRQAFDRGVKIIGATAHYVIAELDGGPILSQDVAHVSHKHNVEDLKRIGRDLERRVLVSAVRDHLEDRIIVHGNKTVVF